MPIQATTFLPGIAALKAPAGGLPSCQQLGLACHVGGTGSSQLVEAAQAHFISATPGIIVPSELAEFEELDGDLVEGLEVADGAVRVPTGAGLGVSSGLEIPGGKAGIR